MKLSLLDARLIHEIWHIGLIKILVLAILWCISSNIHGQGTEQTTLIIRNVKVLTNNSDSSLFHANLLIIDNKLELVSSEELTKIDDMTVLDAEGGFLIGNLTIDGPPRFVILKSDPRKDFDIWLNMEPYIVFAINQGDIRINLLQEDSREIANQKDPYGRIKWFAYTPPPILL